MTAEGSRSMKKMQLRLGPAFDSQRPPLNGAASTFSQDQDLIENLVEVSRDPQKVLRMKF